ncbi:hypothetical protein AOLI_G00231740 [Acnodon oligacanthus]
MEQQPSSSSPSGPGHTPHPTQHEPISFGIDQILSGTDQEPQQNSSKASSDSERVSEGGYPLGSPTGASATPYPAVTGAFHGIAAPYEEARPYGVNLTLTPGGVIRVPAHRHWPLLSRRLWPARRPVWGASASPGWRAASASPRTGLQVNNIADCRFSSA